MVQVQFLHCQICRIFDGKILVVLICNLICCPSLRQDQIRFGWFWNIKCFSSNDKFVFFCVFYLFEEKHSFRSWTDIYYLLGWVLILTNVVNFTIILHAAFSPINQPLKCWWIDICSQFYQCYTYEFFVKTLLSQLHVRRKNDVRTKNLYVGLNFINVLSTAFTLADFKSIKRLTT